MPETRAQPLTHTNVVIIGTGIGGAGISALLAKAGATPVVLERSSIIGGKAGSYERRGFKMEVGIHISPRGKKGPIGDLARMTGADIEFIDKSLLTPSRA